MYQNHYVLSLLLNGNVAKEENGEIRIPFGSEYGLRLKNKLKESCAADIYVDGRLVNEKGSIFIAGNQYLDIDHFVKKDGSKKAFQFVRVGGKDNQAGIEANETQNGLIEVRFYAAKPQTDEVVKYVHEYIERPIYIDRYYYPWDYWYWERPYRHYPITWTTGKGLGESLVYTANNSDTQLSNPSDGPTLMASTGGKGMSAGVPSDTKSFSISECKVECSVNGKNLTLESSGATADGRELFRNDLITTNMRTEKEPTTLTLKLIGYTEKTFRSRSKDIYHCSNCGETVVKGDNFCTHCGYKLAK